MEGESKGHSVLKCFAIIGAFWALILLGPGLVVLINKFNVWFSGMGFSEDSFGYQILLFFSQSIACALACVAAKSVSDGEHHICVLVNQIVCTSLLILLALAMFFIVSEIISGLRFVVAAAVVVFCAVDITKTLTSK